MNKPLSLHGQSFSVIREDGLYYVDKTELVGRIAETWQGMYLFTRPGGFGKTLNLDMLDCFFNMKYAGNTWFDGLKVSGKNDLEIHKNAYPVIKINMKDLGKTFGLFSRKSETLFRKRTGNSTSYGIRAN